jgi:non-specific protein-tyrosine kinase
VTSVKLITLSDPRSAAAEAYRTLRTNLIFSSVERPVHTLLVTSAAQSEDKSLVLANLAVTLAQTGSTTIIVDADLRRPVQHTIWGLPNNQGLTGMVIQDALLAEPPLQATSIPGLSVLTSGELPPIPADVLSSQRMTDIIGLLKARAQFVLFDAPPVLAAADAALLGAKVDGVLLCVHAGATRRDHVARAQQALARVHARLLGAVLTNSDSERAVMY